MELIERDRQLTNISALAPIRKQTQGREINDDFDPRKSMFKHVLMEHMNRGMLFYLLAHRAKPMPMLGAVH